MTPGGVVPRAMTEKGVLFFFLLGLNTDGAQLRLSLECDCRGQTVAKLHR